MALIAMAIFDTPENGRDKFTEQTVDCLANTLDPARHRVFFIINAATERTLDALHVYQGATGCEIIRMPENVGTARAINQAWKRRRPGEHAVKMDNDIVIHYDGWADAMERAIEYDPGIGIVGLKRKDCIQWPGHHDHFFRSVLKFVPFEHTPGHPWVLVEQTPDVMGTCTMFNSALLDQIGYLYQPGLYGFDDVLACVRSKTAGFYNCFLPWIEIDHPDPGGTGYQDWKEKSAWSDMLEYNRLKAGYESGDLPVYCEASYD